MFVVGGLITGVVISMFVVRGLITEGIINIFVVGGLITGGVMRLIGSLQLDGNILLPIGKQHSNKSLLSLLAWFAFYPLS